MRILSPCIVCLNGAGARLFGGRWNNNFYTSESRALANFGVYS